MFSTQQKIRFDDVDGAGIVYYPRFFHMCHKAFEDFFDEVGPISYPRFISDWKRGFPTVRTEGNYLAPLKYGDLARVELKVLEIGSASLKTSYRIIREQGQVLCFEGVVTTVCVDMHTFKSTPIEGALLSFLKAHRE